VEVITKRRIHKGSFAGRSFRLRAPFNVAGYRAKVTGALSYYRLELLEFEDIRATLIAKELEESENPQHVHYATFNTFPRKM
jgi:hypothetical protein